ncbi:MAG: SH3 domain-containing protein [Anaerolinea sp.]|nr:SH3 domain-containing protein [Anaerolinea sp.]
MILYRILQNLNLREQPTTASPSRGVFAAGLVVQFIQFNDDKTWINVTIKRINGTVIEGWMSAKFLKLVDKEPLTWKLGINMREFAYYGSGADGIQFAPEGLRDQQLATARDLGIRYVRFFASRRSHDTAGTIRQLTKAIDSCRKFNLQAFVCLDDSLTGAQMFMQGNDQFHRGPMGHLTMDYFTSRHYRTTFIPHIKKIVTAFANHPNILLWELGNEMGIYQPEGQPQGIPQTAGSNAYVDFVSESSRAIKDISSTHLVSTGLITTHHVYTQKVPPPTREAFARRLYQVPTIDAVGVHYYRHDKHELLQYINVDIAIARELGKPFYVGEVGGDISGGDRTGFLGDEIAFWKRSGAFTVMPWQLDTSDNDVNIGDTLGIAKRRHPDYDSILARLKTLA